MSYRKLIDDAAAMLANRKSVVLEESSSLNDMSFNQLKEKLYNARLQQHNLREGSFDQINNDHEIAKTLAQIEFRQLNEALVGNQHKLDHNKDGKIDASDLHNTRKKGAAVKEAFVDGRTLATQGKMKAGDAVHAKKGELFDFYHPSNGDKVQGKVIANDGKNVVMYHKGQRHNFKISDTLDEEQLDELSKSTLGSYVKKASRSAVDANATAMHLTRNAYDFHQMGQHKSAEREQDASFNATEKSRRRLKGIGKAVAKLTKESVIASIFEKQLDEAHKIGDRVMITHTSAKGAVGHVGEIRHGSYKGAPKTYTIDYQHPKHHIGTKSSIQLSSKEFKAHKEGVLGEAAHKALALKKWNC